MKTNLKFVIGLIVVALTGCSSGNTKQSGLVFFNDFESMRGWSCDMSQLTDYKAHSGSYSTITDSSNQYSFTFKILFKDVSKERIKGINYSIWCYADALPLSGTIVASTKSSTVDPISWNGNNIENYITEAHEWTKIKGHVDFNSKAVNPDNEFGFYFHNTGKTAVLADDFAIEFIK